MKRFTSKFFAIALILAMVFSFLQTQPAQAASTIIAQWTFESPNTPAIATAAVYPNAIAPAVGTGNAGGVHTSTSTAWSAPVGNGSPASFSSNNWSVGNYYQFSTSTAGFTGISVSWDQTGSGTGPRDFKLAYSTDGTNFTDFYSYSLPSPAVSWSSGLTSLATKFSSDLSSVAALDNKPNVYFRLIDTSTTSIGGGTVGTAGTGRVDNFTVSGTGDQAPFVASTVPANNATDVSLNSNITINFSEPVNVTGSWFSLSCASSGVHTATVTGGSSTFTLDPGTDFVGGEACTMTVYAANVTDQDLIDPPNNMTINFTAGFTTATLPIPIHDIQGASHLSPKNGQTVKTQGIVTALRTAGGTRGYYLQDEEANYDTDPSTSEGIFVFTGGSSNPASLVSVGDLVQVTGKVSEFRAAAVGLTVTELVAPLTLTKLSNSNDLPTPIVLGTGGLIPPSTVIEDDSNGPVETSGIFDPANDGIDFYESLEGMLVQVNDAVAVGPRSDFTSNREIPVVGDDGANAGVRTNRGGILAQSGDFNPERIILNDWISGGATLPAANVGDKFPGVTLGVIDYSFNNFKLQVISMPALVSGGLTQEATVATGLNQVSAAAFNVENLAYTDPQSKFDTLAELIVNHMQSPDIMAIEEIQDNTGATNDGTVDASQTWNRLITAIQTAGGPIYQYRQIDPVNNQDGGATGGNIRVGFLFRIDRGLSFIDRPGAGSLTANTVVGAGSSARLQYSPGRIDPTNAAFSTSRKPLAGEFMFNGHHLFVIANHWNSKGGDEPLFGVNQPPTFSSEVQRNQQATVVHNFVNDILTADANANVLVMGDLNDFQFSSALATLKGSPAILTDLIETLPLAERYSYVFEGNSETLDHILATSALMARPYVYDVVHVNSEFANQASDHEPQAMVITLNDPPTADAGGPYSAVEGGSALVSASGTDPENGPLTYDWDLDNNGSFETSGQSVTFNVGSLDGPGSYTINARVTDNGGLFAIADATVNVSNVAPTATFGTPGTVNEGASFGISLTSVFDPSATDTTAGFTYAFDCGFGYGTFDSSNTATCPTIDNGILNVGGKVKDKDGGISEYTSTVTVNNVSPSVAVPIVSPEPSTEGSSVTVSAAFTDPGVNDAPFTCTVNYGDGSGNLSGVVNGYTCTGPAHTYSTFGSYTVTISVTDKDGSAGSNMSQHFVIFNWAGFFQPVDNLPTLNVVKAGSAIPVKFSLGGNKGLNIFAAGYPVSQQIACDTGAPLDDIEVTVTAGSSSLSFDPLTNQYNYVWKTEKSWAGTCRQLTVRLVDGTSHYANFKFK